MCQGTNKEKVILDFLLCNENRSINNLVMKKPSGKINRI